jgi:hypothetical protein
MRTTTRVVFSASLFSFLTLAACSGNSDRPHFQETSAALEARDRDATSEDVEILERAAEILSSPAAWDRQDDRTCDPEATRWSLFCALQKASIEVLGEYQHRRVALQEVRFAIEDVTGGREFEHRLMDFNNLHATTFEDVHQVLSLARDRVTRRLP